MALNIFQKKEKEKADKAPKEGKGTVPAKEEKKAEEKPQKRSRQGTLANFVLTKPHITEKAARLGEESAYVFRVHSQANKHQVKEAVEQAYGVHVTKVRVVRVPAKKVRLGRRREGVKSGYKKAMVSIQKGEKLDILPL